MRNLLDGTESISTQIQTITLNEDVTKGSISDVVWGNDSAIHTQMSELESIRDLIDKLETELETCSFQIADLQQFQASGGPALQEAQMQKIKEEAQNKTELRAAEIKKIQTKHEASLLATSRRAEHIISEIETNANKARPFYLLMEMTRMMIVRRNRKLKELLNELKHDCEKLKKAVENLEIINISIYRNLYSLDWNLMHEVENPTPSAMRDPSPQAGARLMPILLEGESARRKTEFEKLGIEGTPWKSRRHMAPILPTNDETN
ncbi:hypothetical protein HDU97_009741 [Phlyctochytrium planicorne]|nr:hypothetical protein HDU97_009741 [Phlyctochytrium planicorne]